MCLQRNYSNQFHTNKLKVNHIKKQTHTNIYTHIYTHIYTYKYIYLENCAFPLKTKRFFSYKDAFVRKIK